MQSFETTNLRELSEMIDVPLMQLIAGRGRRTTWWPPVTHAPTPTW